MNIALIIAGGRGMRMGQEIPQQFLTVEDKPVIAYTMEAFQKHPDIDAIAVVCVEGWDSILSAYARQYGISKLRHIVPGGENGQASIRNGVFEQMCIRDSSSRASCRNTAPSRGSIRSARTIWAAIPLRA